MKVLEVAAVCAAVCAAAVARMVRCPGSLDTAMTGTLSLASRIFDSSSSNILLSNWVRV